MGEQHENKKRFKRTEKEMADGGGRGWFGVVLSVCTPRRTAPLVLRMVMILRLSSFLELFSWQSTNCLFSLNEEGEQKSSGQLSFFSNEEASLCFLHFCSVGSRLTELSSCMYSCVYVGASTPGYLSVFPAGCRAE